MKNKAESIFVTYEIAMMLNKLGYKDPCFGWYHKQSNIPEQEATLFFVEYLMPEDNNIELDIEQFKDCGNGPEIVANSKLSCSAPTKDQAIEWLEEKLEKPIYTMFNIDDSSSGYGWGYRIAFDEDWTSGSKKEAVSKMLIASCEMLKKKQDDDTRIKG